MKLNTLMTFLLFWCQTVNLTDLESEEGTFAWSIVNLDWVILIFNVGSIKAEDFSVRI